MYFNDFQNQISMTKKFSMTKETQAKKIKQNQKLFSVTYSNLTSFFIGRRVLKHFSDLYNWHLSILMQK